MKVLVTGGAGFIGSHLVRRLVVDGHDVVVLDNLSTGRIANIKDVGLVATLVGDIRNLEVCLDAAHGCEAVFHLAALGSVPRSIEDPFTTNDVNVTGTLNVLEAARRSSVERLVFASSSSVYGTGGVSRRIEAQTLRPLSPYGVSKLAGEHYCDVYAQVFGLATTLLRFFNVFGERQNPDGPYAAVIPRFIHACLNGDPMTIYGDGGQTRDFTYVGNVVDACLLALEKMPGGPFNIGCGAATTVTALAALVAEACEKPDAPVEHVAERTGDVRGSEAAITRATISLKYAPKVDVAEGLRRTVEWFKEVR